MTEGSRAVLQASCRALGIDAGRAEVVRLGENEIWRIPGLGIARVARPGQVATASREVRIGRWLAASGVRAVEPLPVDQPQVVDERAVTFWAELPPHRQGTPAEVADALRQLHQLALPPSNVGLVALDPFVRVRERIAASCLPPADRRWLGERAEVLEHRYHHLPATHPHCVVHGDAWAGNVVATDAGHVTFVDLERLSVGPPEWDLVSTAVKRHSLGAITADDYADYCRHYGLDVTRWPGYQALRDIRELRMTTYVAQLGTARPDAAGEATHRLRCLRGDAGPRPWSWTGF